MPARPAPSARSLQGEKKKRSAVDSDLICCYKIRMKNNNSSKTPSIATLIRDGYLQEHEADDANYVSRAKMEWMDDYAAYLLDEVNND
jgi:hypothetical protein